MLRRLLQGERTMRQANAIDFWRGFALVEIFINHVPDNGLWRLTHRQYSWSDAAEALVFLAGFSMAIRIAAYPNDVVSFVTNRLSRIYVMHVVVTFILAAIYFVAHTYFDDETIFVDYHFDVDLHGAGPMALGAALLTEHISYFNILPLYFILTAFVPIMVALARASHAALFFASATLYALAQMGLEINQWPSGRFWSFNPFAWQFVFVLGYLAGARRDEILDRLERTPALIVAAVGFVVVSAICVRMGLPASHSQDRGVIEALVFHKTDVGPARVLQFVALAVVAWRFAPIAARVAPWAWRLCALLGRNSLAVFGTSAVVAGIGQVLARQGFYGMFYDLAFAGGAVLLFVGVSLMCEGVRLRRRVRSTAAGAVLASPGVDAGGRARV